MVKFNLKEHIKRHYLAFSLYLFITVYFLFQHFTLLSWDFSAYVLNARYLFYNGSYFELYRAPLTSIFLAIFMILGKLGEYIFIFFVSTLFYIGMYKLSRIIAERFFEKKFSDGYVFFLFYFLSLGSFVFMYGTLVGTELLSLAFFILFLVNYLENKSSGHYLALAFLTRYNFIFFLPLLLIRKDIKKIIKDFVLFFIVSFPWFLWNFINYGNWFSSVIDSYFLNVYSRQHLIEAFNWLYLLHVFSWRLPLFIIGLIIATSLLMKNKNQKSGRIIVIFLLVFCIIFYDSYNIPFKVERYLFGLILPISFFSLLGLLWLIKKFRISKKLMILICFVYFITLFSIHIGITEKNLGDRDLYPNTAKIIYDQEIANCMIRSPIWVPVSYYTENVYFLDVTISDAVKRGDIVLIFKGIATFDDNFTRSEFENYKPFYEDDKILLFGDKDNCNEKFKVFNFVHKNDFCETFSYKFGKGQISEFAKGFCRLINFKREKDLITFR